MLRLLDVVCFFFFNDTATTEIYTLSLHDALPIFHASNACCFHLFEFPPDFCFCDSRPEPPPAHHDRSEEHTSGLQSQSNLVCRLLLEKKKKINNTSTTSSFIT